VLKVPAVSPEDSELSSLAAQTQEVYQRNAARFDAERPKGMHERVWFDRFLKLVHEGGAILDLGCGAGDPIAAYMSARGHSVTGVDASQAMLALAQDKYPDGDWRWGDMRRLDLVERFDGIVGWNSFFHLRQDEQRSVLPLLAKHLKDGGVLMLTVGPEAGEVSGHVGDDAVYHSSLSPEEYESILRDLGLSIAEFVKEDPDCDFQTVLLATKTAPQG